MTSPSLSVDQVRAAVRTLVTTSQRFADIPAMNPEREDRIVNAVLHVAERMGFDEFYVVMAHACDLERENAEKELAEREAKRKAEKAKREARAKKLQPLFDQYFGLSAAGMLFEVYEPTVELLDDGKKHIALSYDIERLSSNPKYCHLIRAKVSYVAGLDDYGNPTYEQEACNVVLRDDHTLVDLSCNEAGHNTIHFFREVHKGIRLPPMVVDKLAVGVRVAHSHEIMNSVIRTD